MFLPYPLLDRLSPRPLSLGPELRKTVDGKLCTNEFLLHELGQNIETPSANHLPCGLTSKSDGQERNLQNFYIMCELAHLKERYLFK